jgi:hypothetical protein
MSIERLQKRQAQALKALGKEPEVKAFAERWRSAKEAVEDYFGLMISVYRTDELIQAALAHDTTGEARRVLDEILRGPPSEAR